MNPASLSILSTLAGFLLVGLILLILFLEFRDLILGKRLTATVTQIIESPSTDADGNERIDRFPEIEFIDPNGNQIRHQLVLTNVSMRKPGDKFTIYYKAVKSGIGYKICSPFMWPKVILLFILSVGALLLIFGTSR